LSWRILEKTRRGASLPLFSVWLIAIDDLPSSTLLHSKSEKSVHGACQRGAARLVGVFFIPYLKRFVTNSRMLEIKFHSVHETSDRRLFSSL
jgi:hypothetical protein